MPVRPAHDQFQDDRQLTVLFPHGATSFCLQKLLPPRCRPGGGSLLSDKSPTSPSLVVGIEIKQTFPSTKLGSFLAFGWWSARPHFWLYEQQPAKNNNKPEALESSSLLLHLHCGFKEASCHESYSREKVHFANDLRNLDVSLSAFRSVTRT